MGLTPSTNFAFLARHEEGLVLLASQAELLFSVEPVASITKVRAFAELLALEAAARVGLYTSRDEAQIDRLRRLRDRGVVAGEADQAFHSIRKAGNAAVHDNVGDFSTAFHCIKLAYSLAVWFERSFGEGRAFKAPLFSPPRPPTDATEALKKELDAAKARASAAEDAAAAAQRTAEDARRAKDEADRARATAEERAAREAQDRAAAEALMAELAQREAAMLERLARIQAKASAASSETITNLVEAASVASTMLDLDEASTRRLVDEQLRAAGWEADTATLRHAAGARPIKGRNLAIAEWPTEDGPADYVLFSGLTPLAVVEAKRAHKNVAAVLGQSARYARAFRAEDGLELLGPFEGGLPIPFLFATNGRAYLKQLAEKSGIWFRDARRKTNHAAALPGWYTPEGLRGLLRQDAVEAHAKLDAEPVEDLGLRSYQNRAIRAAEQAIQSGQRSILLAMATGTGKTRTCIGLTYRLLKHRRFRRILFLVDRSALGAQTYDAFCDARLEAQQSFDQIFDLKGLDALSPDPDTKLHIATVQSLVRRVLYADDDAPAVDTYDCIVVDECHRGYTLDRELSEGELTFRDEADYISKYRRVLEHFDAVKIGLTATPALHTREIFGDPVYTYGYREAVIDGYLVDHEPPIRIVTALAADGITFQAKEEVEVYQPTTGELQLSLLPDEVHLDIDQFHRRVLTEAYNRVVCAQLAGDIDPALPGKTLLFCVNDEHADLVVRVLKEELTKRWGPIEDDAVQKITGSVDRPLEKIRRFKNERLPSFAVTVDLLTTGIDVPAIVNLVFLRRVRSRVLYEQMLGRATRLCPDIGKDVFRIYDAVDLYAALAPYTDMKPVVVSPGTTFTQLATELVKLKDAELQKQVRDQLVAKLARKVRHLHPSAAEMIETEAGRSPAELLGWLRATPVPEVRAFFAQHPRVAELLDAKASGTGPGGILVSHHEDALRSREHGYGPGRSRPEDYLDGFAAFVRQQGNEIPALLVVTQRPRELTREQLKALRLALDRAGYPESHLRTAWRDRTNQDIAASIIGYVRQAALGDALVPYEERVDGALKRILSARRFTEPQRKWLERIGKAMKRELVLDRAAIDAEGTGFKDAGGYAKLDKVFEGQLETILGDLADEVWKAGT